MSFRMLSIVLAAAVPATASAQWMGGHEYDRGHGPAVAMNDANAVLEAHRTNNLITSQDMWYHLGGIMPNGTVSWGESHRLSDDYNGDGYEVAVAMNRHLALEVHRDSDWGLWYQVGAVDMKNKVVHWGDKQLYDDGQNPSVAINNKGVLVEIHQDSGISDKLYYRVGQAQYNLDGSLNGINWGPGRYFANGYKPSVAINDNGLVVEAHENVGGDFNMDATAGHVDAGSFTIEWGRGRGYDDGRAPRIGLRNDNAVVEIHQSEVGFIWFHLGQVIQDLIYFDNGALLTDGHQPSIATNNNLFTTEVHEGGDVENHLWYDVRRR